MDILNWSDESKLAIVLEGLHGNATIEEVCKKYKITPLQFHNWTARFISEGKISSSVIQPDAFNEADSSYAHLHKLRKLNLGPKKGSVLNDKYVTVAKDFNFYRVT